MSQIDLYFVKPFKCMNKSKSKTIVLDIDTGISLEFTKGC